MVWPRYNNMMDKVSIIIVTYNAEKDLQSCLDSIRSQTYASIEVIVADGASQDGTIAILKKNEDLVTKWISEKDQGIYDAMNKALDLATGDWIYFLGADDTLLPGFSDMANALKNKHIIYYGSILSKGVKCQSHISSYNQAKNGICHQSIFYPKRVFEKYRFDLEYKIAADRHLNMKCFADPEFNMKYLDFTIANFNHTGISSQKDDLLFEERKAGLIKKYHGRGPWLRFMFKKLKHSLF